MSFKIVNTVLASAVADDGTVTLAYPAGTNQAFFTGANAAADGVVVLNDNEVYPEADPGISLTYGASNITLTNLTGLAWAAGTSLRVQLGYAGSDRPAFQPAPAIASVAAAGGTYAQAEVNAAITAINKILSTLRSEGIISS